MSWKKAEVDPVDGFPLPQKKPELAPGPRNGKGFYTNAGYYVPTEEEYRSKYSDIPLTTDVSNEKLRLIAWLNPNMRHLNPQSDKNEISKMGKNGQLELKNRKEEAKRIRNEVQIRRDFILEMIEERISDPNFERLKPRQVMQMVMEDAYVNGDTAIAVQIADKLLPYHEQKLAAKEVISEEIDLGKATDKDLEDLTDGRITYEEFERKSRGE